MKPQVRLVNILTNTFMKQYHISFTEELPLELSSGNDDEKTDEDYWKILDQRELEEELDEYLVNQGTGDKEDPVDSDSNQSTDDDSDDTDDQGYHICIHDCLNNFPTIFFVIFRKGQYLR
jgi:hypothetical protein